MDQSLQRYNLLRYIGEIDNLSSPKSTKIFKSIIHNLLYSCKITYQGKMVPLPNIYERN